MEFMKNIFVHLYEVFDKTLIPSTSDGHFANYACTDNVVFINNRSWS